MAVSKQIVEFFLTKAPRAGLSSPGVEPGAWFEAAAEAAVVPALRSLRGGRLLAELQGNWRGDFWRPIS